MTTEMVVTGESIEDPILCILPVTMPPAVVLLRARRQADVFRQVLNTNGPHQAKPWRGMLRFSPSLFYERQMTLG
jgi:hypothetical protein